MVWIGFTDPINCLAILRAILGHYSSLGYDLVSLTEWVHKPSSGGIDGEST